MGRKIFTSIFKLCLKINAQLPDLDLWTRIWQNFRYDPSLKNCRYITRTHKQSKNVTYTKYILLEYSRTSVTASCALIRLFVAAKCYTYESTGPKDYFKYLSVEEQMTTSDDRKMQKPTEGTWIWTTQFYSGIQGRYSIKQQVSVLCGVLHKSCCELGRHWTTSHLCQSAKYVVDSDLGRLLLWRQRWSWEWTERNKLNRTSDSICKRYSDVLAYT